MRPTEFTDEEIINAGLALQKANRNITGFALRQEVGGGTASRLKQVWDDFVNSQLAEESPNLPIELAGIANEFNNDMRSMIASVILKVNDAVLDVAERRYLKINSDLKKRCELAAQELEDAYKTIIDAENEVDFTKEENGRLKIELASTLKINSRLDGENKVLQAQNLNLLQMIEKNINLSKK